MVYQNVKMARNLKKCEQCDMFGGNDSFVGRKCKGCERTEILEKKVEEQQRRMDELDTRLEELLRNKEMGEKELVRQSRFKEMEEKMNKIKISEEKMIKIH